MTLRAYLIMTGTRVTAFAKLIDVTRVTVQRWLSGKSFPRWPAMIRIALVTGGKVTPDDWLLGGSAGQSLVSPAQGANPQSVARKGALASSASRFR